MAPKYIVITCGDPTGAGYEIILKILTSSFPSSKNTIFKNFFPLLVAEQEYVDFSLTKLKLAKNVTPFYLNKDIFFSLKCYSIPRGSFLCCNPIEAVSQCHSEELRRKSEDEESQLNDKMGCDTATIINCKFNHLSPGHVALVTLETGLDLISKLKQENKIVGLLTMPVSKNAISEYLNKNKCWKNFITQELNNSPTRDLEFSGHTEYIAKKFGIEPQKVSMLMVGKDKTGFEYKTLLLTRHIPLTDVCKTLNKKNVVEQVLNVSKFLLKYEMNQKHKIEILFCGVNPHTGENGKLGVEEKTILIPAIITLNKIIKTKNLKIKIIQQPVLTEQAFCYAKTNRNVLIVCSYHDQAMVPLKILCGHNIVNITVGLPFIRVSPGHGTAQDIAGKGIADIQPTLFAIEKLKKYLR